MEGSPATLSVCTTGPHSTHVPIPRARRSAPTRGRGPAQPAPGGERAEQQRAREQHAVALDVAAHRRVDQASRSRARSDRARRPREAERSPRGSAHRNASVTATRRAPSSRGRARSPLRGRARASGNDHHEHRRRRAGCGSSGAAALQRVRSAPPARAAAPRRGSSAAAPRTAGEDHTTRLLARARPIGATARARAASAKLTPSAKVEPPDPHVPRAATAKKTRPAGRTAVDEHASRSKSAAEASTATAPSTRRPTATPTAGRAGCSPGCGGRRTSCCPRARSPAVRTAARPVELAPRDRACVAQGSATRRRERASASSGARASSAAAGAREPRPHPAGAAPWGPRLHPMSIARRTRVRSATTPDPDPTASRGVMPEQAHGLCARCNSAWLPKSRARVASPKDGRR